MGLEKCQPPNVYNSSSASLEDGTRRQTFSAYKRCEVLGIRGALALTPPDLLRQPFFYLHACRTLRPRRRLPLGDSLVGIVDEVDAQAYRLGRNDST